MMESKKRKAKMTKQEAIHILMHIDTNVEYDEDFGIMIKAPLMDAIVLAIKALEAEAVEVVRCKDCGGWCRNVGIKDSPNGHCFTHDIDTNGFDFCSYGERKDNERKTD